MWRMRWLMEQEGAGGAGGGGTQPPPPPADWRAALPEALRSDPSLSSFKDVGALAQSYVETKSLVGRSIRPPPADAPAAAKKEFVDRLLQIEPALVYAPDGDPTAVDRMWQRLGKPAKAEEYAIGDEAKAAGLKEEELRALAVTSGMTKGQFKEFVGVATKAKLEEKRLEALDRLALEQEWGAAKEERTLAARAAALKMGLTEPEVQALSPKQLRVFANVARAVGVNSNEFQRHVDGRPTSGALAPAEARAKMEEIRADPDFFDAYRNPARHKQLVDKMSTLAKDAFPG